MHTQRPPATRHTVLAGRDVPLAYLITFTTFGTWLHGDARGSVDRGHNIPGTPHLAASSRRVAAECSRARQPSVTFDAAARKAVEQAIVEVCAYRDWTLHAYSVRTNHVHVVACAPVRPEAVLHDFKAYATRALRKACATSSLRSPWTAGGSARYLWKPDDVEAACAYVSEGQGPDLAKSGDASVGRTEP